MSGPPFVMSMYASETDLLRDKCAWLERELAEKVSALSEGRSIKDKLAWCVEDLTKQLKARERELSKVLQQQAEADNERDAVEEGLRAYAELLRRELEDCCTRMDRCKGILRADRQAPEGWNVLDTKHARAALAKNPAAANAPVVNVTEGRPAPLPEASAGPECVHETNQKSPFDNPCPDCGREMIRLGRDRSGEDFVCALCSIESYRGSRHQSNSNVADAVREQQRAEPWPDDLELAWFKWTATPAYAAVLTATPIKDRPVGVKFARAAFEAAFTSRHQVCNVPKGWKLVPVEPSQEQWQEFFERLWDTDEADPILTLSKDALRSVYARALAALSTPPSGIVVPPIGAHPELTRAVNGPVPDYKALYHELLFAVGNKYEGETRHQTALRYITRAEPPGSQVGDECHVAGKKS